MPVLSTALVAALALGGVALTILEFRSEQQTHAQFVEDHFRRAARDRASVIEAALRKSEEQLRVLGAFLDAVEQPGADRFERFATPLVEDNPALLGLSWNAYVPAARLDAFERATRAEIPGYAVKGSALGERAAYVPVVYIAPRAPNEAAVGFDVASEATRRAALERARDEGVPIATAPVRLVQDAAGQLSILIFRPVYRRGATPADPAARGELLAGFAVAVIRLGDLVGRALDLLEPGGVDIALAYLAPDGSEQRAHFHSSRRRPADAPVVRIEPGAEPRTSVSLEVAGQRWIVHMAAAPPLLADGHAHAAWPVLGAGLAITALVTFVLGRMVRRAYRMQLEQATLERRVDERTAALEHTQRELQRRDRLARLGQLIGTVAHELRNPLGTIRNSVETLERGCDDGGPVPRGPVQRVRQSVDRCNRIIEELLASVRQTPLMTGPTVLDRWLVDLLDEYPEQAGVELIRRLQSGDALAEIDPDRLRRAIINLLDNAHHAVAARQADGAHPTRGRVVVTTGVDGDAIRIAVEDEGDGIAPERLEEIFEPLYTTRAQGTGLGLPTALTIVEQHGGRLTIASERGEGTRAEITLPHAGLPGEAP